MSLQPHLHVHDPECISGIYYMYTPYKAWMASLPTSLQSTNESNKKKITKLLEWIFYQPDYHHCLCNLKTDQYTYFLDVLKRKLEIHRYPTSAYIILVSKHKLMLIM